MEDANENSNSGDTFDAETCAACLDAEPEDIKAIVDAMTGKGLIDGDGGLSRWEKRQPKREDDSSDRVRRYREKKRTETNASDDVT